MAAPLLVHKALSFFRPAFLDHLDEHMPVIGIGSSVPWLPGDCKPSYYFVIVKRKADMLPSMVPELLQATQASEATHNEHLQSMCQKAHSSYPLHGIVNLLIDTCVTHEVTYSSGRTSCNYILHKLLKPWFIQP